MFGKIDLVPWGKLKHAYGDAVDAPKWIRAFDSAEEEDRMEAINYFLLSCAFHQYTLYTVTPFVIPFVIEALESATLGERSTGMCSSMKLELIHFLRLCAQCGQRAMYGHPSPQAPTVEDSIFAGEELYQRCVEDSDERVRSDALWLLDFCRAGKTVRNRSELPF